MPARFLGDDATFVRADADAVYGLLTNFDLWRLWNPKLVLRRCSVSDDEAPPDLNRWLAALRTGFARQMRFGLRADGWRHNEGFWVQLSGDIDGSSEWWLEAERSGVVVHHLVRVHDAIPNARGVERQQTRRVEQYRRAMRMVMWGVREYVHSRNARCG